MESNETFGAKKSLGQHFLTSPIVPGWMCDAAGVKPDDIILEIGPGTGVLTREILARGAHVLAFETDQRAIELLQKTFATEIISGKLELITTDVRTLDLSLYPKLRDHHYKVVANIPYYLSGFLFRSFLQTKIQPNTLVYLVQKEVAKRATESIAKGGKESLLSLSTQVFGIPQYIKTVGRGHFSPPPKVDSAIIAITDINRCYLDSLSEDFFFALLHLGFGQKRKQLLGNLTERFDRVLLTHTFSTLGIPLTIRAEDLSLEKWLSLANSLHVVLP